MGERTAYDVVIVGARCAGATTAMLLARAGLRVLAVDRSAYGSDALSTHALMRGAVLQLARFGVLDAVRAAGTPPIRAASFHYGAEVTEVAIKPRDGVDALYAPRRTVLDPILVDAARDAGAEVWHGLRVVDLVRDASGRVRGVVVEDARGQRAIEAALVIGADGIKSTVARLVGARPHRVGSYAAGFVYGYFSGLPTDGLHWCYATTASAGFIPTGDRQHCVFVATRSARLGATLRAELEASFPMLLSEAAPRFGAAMATARRHGRLRVFRGAPGFVRQSWGPGWALVGDAGYFRDPITAHGITDALRDAELLAHAVVRGSDQALEDYQWVRDDLAVPLLELSDDIASYELDLDAIRRRHVSLSEELSRGTRLIGSLSDVAA